MPEKLLELARQSGFPQQSGAAINRRSFERLESGLATDTQQHRP